MGILFVICIIAIGVLIMNIKGVQKLPYISMRIVCTLLFMGSIMRYVTLLLFARVVSMEVLVKTQDFYFITLIGIAIESLLLLWYITPFYRQKIKGLVMVIVCMPWLIFYTLLVALKPYQMIKAETLGYRLQLIGNWDLYLKVFQVSFMVLLILGALYGLTLYKHQQVKGQYIILILCQLLLLADSFIYLTSIVPSIPVFTLTEVFAFLGIYYGFSKPPIDARGIKKQKRLSL